MEADPASTLCEADLTIVSDEAFPRLQPLRCALDRHGLRSEVVSAARFASQEGSASIAYLRRLDPALANAAYVAQVVSRSVNGAETINTPESVRTSEWLPLASEAFRKHDVSQPRRAWCLNDHDLRRAVRDLGFPLVAEGLVSHKRVLALTSTHLAEAVRRAHATPDSEPRGVVLEQWTESISAAAAVLVVAGRPASLRLARGSDPSRTHARRIEEVATRAVAALGGHIMAAIVTCDTQGNPAVRRVDAAPDLALFGRNSLVEVVGEIARMLNDGRALRMRRALRRRREVTRRTSPPA